MLMGECIEHDVKLSRELGDVSGSDPLIKLLSIYAMSKFIGGAKACARRMKMVTSSKLLLKH